MSILTVIFFGLLPSFIWLLLYLRKDSHPESNKMILKIFFFGILITFPTALVEMGFSSFLSELFLPPFILTILYWFIGIALTEEFLKYLLVREKVLKNEEFDEPVDAMIYMIIAGLGFAAAENMLILMPTSKIFLETISISALRFLGATFLHALCSATIGYFLALSLCQTKSRSWLIIKGLAIATLLHGIYNLSIIEAENNSSLIIIPIILLISLALFVSYGFRKLKNLASVCKIQ